VGCVQEVIRLWWTFNKLLYTRPLRDALEEIKVRFTNWNLVHQVCVAHHHQQHMIVGGETGWETRPTESAKDGKSTYPPATRFTHSFANLSLSSEVAVVVAASPQRCRMALATYQRTRMTSSNTTLSQKREIQESVLNRSDFIKGVGCHSKTPPNYCEQHNRDTT
jgi:hypothetical protein